MAGGAARKTRRDGGVMRSAVLALIVSLTPGLLAQPLAPGPGDPAARLMHSGRYARALELLHSSDSDDSLHQTRLALCYLRTGDAYRADSLLATVAARDFQRPYLLYWQGEARALAGDHAGAAAVFREMPARTGGPAADSAAVAYLRETRLAGDTASVERAIEGIISRNNGIAVLGWRERMLLRIDEGDSAGWADAWTTMLQRYPRTETTRRAASVAAENGWAPQGQWIIKLARMYERHGDRAEAVRAWTRALDDPYFSGRQTEVHYYLAKTLLDLRRYHQAAEQLNAALEDESDRTWRPRLLRLYAKLERRRDRETQSRRWEREFLRRFPNHDEAPDALWNIGMSWERSRNFDEAISAFRELHRRFPSSDEAAEGSWRTGFCHYRRGDYEDAYREFSGLASTTRSFVIQDQAGFWAGKALEQLGRNEEATAAWDLAAAYSPRTYYAVAAAVKAGRPVVPPEDENPPDVGERPAPDSWPGYTEAHWLASLGQLEWARSVLVAAVTPHATSVQEKESVADALESLGDYAQSIRWRWKAMWSRTTEDRYHMLAPDVLRRVWPDFFREQVMPAARENGVEPTLLWAIMRQESVFNPDVTSSADARGLMQVIPSTGRALARDMRMAEFDSEDLYDPETNVRIGSYYVSRLLRRFDGRIDLVAAAYNAGPGNAVRWNRASGADEDVLRESITYSETRKYVKLVLKNYYIYQGLYPQSEQSP